MNKGQIFFKIFFEITRFKVGISKNIASFAQISTKTGFEIFCFLQHFKKGRKWPNSQNIQFLANCF